MARRSAEERLEELKRREQDLLQKQSQVTARRKQIENQIKAKERRERTHRLIQVGATFEQHWGYLDAERADLLARRLANIVDALVTELNENDTLKRFEDSILMDALLDVIDEAGEETRHK